MCGIVGYIGINNATEILLKGLEKLEYRGYDSAGIALLNKQGIHTFKEKGRIANLREHIDLTIEGTTGIGHTRWATHGAPNRMNAHPHSSKSGRFTLVHNGVIENAAELKGKLLHVQLKSDTDTEVIVQLIEQSVNEGCTVEAAFRTTLEKLQGSYAIVLLDSQDDGTMYVAKNKSPLLIGLGEGFNVVASDAMAMLEQTNRFIEIMDEEMAFVKQNKVSIKNLAGETVERNPFTVEFNVNDIEKGTYPHYMLKEIEEQPAVIRQIISHYQDKDGMIQFDQAIQKEIVEADRLYIIACGTSYHAGLIGKQLFEHVAHKPTEVHVASEFLYNMPLLSEKPLFIFISQSGETADSRGVLVKIKQLGYKAITITNVPGSTLSREADYTLHTHAGPEIAVASTKAYTAQMAVLALLSAQVATLNQFEIGFDPVQELSIVANAMESVIDKKEKIEEISRGILSISRNCFFIGRGIDYAVCLEGALKLKEISYIQAEGFAGGELKHGTIALIEKNTPVIALASQEHVNGSIRSNVKEVEARGANTCIISMEGLDRNDDRFVFPRVHKLLTPLAAIIPFQLIAYYAALHRGCDVDKPRNLAKSVTVE
ncbi:glutamine--fructose-6-phosphate transaminase (isomerizing) [Pueribacillus theae]|uniref:Glutamine--fructose-6-phosphate aminotransferase [isomerizing] n=1 Tax=Pueribacillus theae TaxID=2171751 RepID=A0A2U1JVL1_9BACI|nr:glutamine--fructose-6-phosphate transaminase (isomerizing) [Pueribacillus theae]PWA09247.1 glutamine--fructose-6-phosphate transaminase (isomerizing) [Pueribacillus theae]